MHVGPSYRVQEKFTWKGWYCLTVLNQHVHQDDLPHARTCVASKLEKRGFLERNPRSATSYTPNYRPTKLVGL